MIRKRPQPVNRESEFRSDEMFFSCTDLKGVILSGNDVFVRVSKYPLQELIGAPHNIIRHPDMPKVVFKLLWDYIQSGKPIVAYVKNMAKDGSYYWVLASVMPVKDNSGQTKEYISIRIKPTSGYFKLIPDLYRKMLEAEKEGGMESSYRVLNETLKQIGYESYDDFMKDALLSELKDKTGIFGSKIDLLDHYYSGYKEAIYKSVDLYGHIESLFGFILKFEELRELFSREAEDVYKMADEIRLTSLNSSIESVHLGSSGSVFSVISSEMRKNSEEESKIIRQMRSLIQKNTREIRDIIFTISLSKLEVLMLIDFLISSSDNGARNKRNVENFYYLISSSYDYFNELSHLMEVSFESLSSLNKKIKKLKVLVEELEAMYFRGLIESGYFEETKFPIIYTSVKKLVTKNKENILNIEKAVVNVLDSRSVADENIEKVKLSIKDLKDILSKSH